MINWLPLFTVLSITPILNICHLCYTPTPQHVSFAPPPSIFSPNLVWRLLSPLVVFSMLAPLFGTPSHLIWDLSTPTPPSNLKLTCSVLQAFLAPKFNPCASDSHLHIDFSAKIILHYIQQLWIVLKCALNKKHCWHLVCCIIWKNCKCLCIN